jgi:lysophospholipase L1-like esterase
MSGGPHVGARYYVSVGDSYAAGYQPAHGGQSAGTSRNGFAYQVTRGLRGVTLVNFGCSGETTAQALTSHGCLPAALGPGAQDYPQQSQVAAAAGFLAQHAGHIAAVTVVLGGDDIQACGPPTKSGWYACAVTALTRIRSNLTSIMTTLRGAAGDAPIVGLSYPDVYLGAYLSHITADRQIAAESVGFFRTTVNPVLAGVYRQAGATFLDVTAQTGAYAPATPLVAAGAYGALPPPVADVCRLTFVCSAGDVHPTTAGYDLIAAQILAALRA